MLFRFSLLVFLIIGLNKNVYAKDIILITHSPFQLKQAKLAKKILQEKMGIPSKLITLKKSISPCTREQALAAHLCLDQLNDIVLVHRNDEVVEFSLSQFWKTEQL